MGGKKSSEHREDVHDPPPGCAEATALALARDCRSCAHGRSSASSLGPEMRPWREGTATARNRDEGGLLDRQLRHRLHQPNKVDDRREGLVQKLELDEEWIHTCMGAAGGVFRHPAKASQGCMPHRAFSPCAHASPCIYPLNARKGGFGGMLGAHGSAHLARPQSWHRELILSQLLRARRQCRGRWLPPGRAARDGCRTARSARRCRRSRAGRLVSSRRALMLFSNAAPQELIKSGRDCKVGPFRPVTF